MVDRHLEAELYKSRKTTNLYSAGHRSSIPDLVVFQIQEPRRPTYRVVHCLVQPRAGSKYLNRQNGRLKGRSVSAGERGAMLDLIAAKGPRQVRKILDSGNENGAFQKEARN